MQTHNITQICKIWLRTQLTTICEIKKSFFFCSFEKIEFGTKEKRGTDVKLFTSL